MVYMIVMKLATLLRNSNSEELATMPRHDDPNIWELICVLRNARNTARRRRSAADDTGHPHSRYYSAIETGLSDLLFHLSKYSYR